METPSQSGWTLTCSVAAFLVLLLLASFATASKGDDTPRCKMLQHVRDGFRQINPVYARIPLFEGESSFTENKASITLCLRDPHTNQPYSFNTVMYVALHELAHVITDTYEHDHGNHGPRFKANFKKLLDYAVRNNLYDPSFPIPANYCKIK